MGGIAGGGELRPLGGSQAEIDARHQRAIQQMEDDARRRQAIRDAYNRVPPRTQEPGPDATVFGTDFGPIIEAIREWWPEYNLFPNSRLGNPIGNTNPPGGTEIEAQETLEERLRRLLRPPSPGGPMFEIDHEGRRFIPSGVSGHRRASADPTPENATASADPTVASDASYDNTPDATPNPDAAPATPNTSFYDSFISQILAMPEFSNNPELAAELRNLGIGEENGEDTPAPTPRRRGGGTAPSQAVSGNPAVGNAIEEENSAAIMRNRGTDPGLYEWHPGTHESYHEGGWGIENPQYPEGGAGIGADFISSWPPVQNLSWIPGYATTSPTGFWGQGNNPGSGRTVASLTDMEKLYGPGIGAPIEGFYIDPSSANMI
jgi:hypothetical protein